MQQNVFSRIAGEESAGRLLRSFHALRFPWLSPDQVFQFDPDSPLVQKHWLKAGVDYPTTEAAMTDKELTAVKKASILVERYKGVGMFLSANLIVKGEDIDEFLRSSADATDLEVTHPLTIEGYDLNDILPDPETLESMHFTGPNKICDPLVKFVVAQTRIAFSAIV